MPRIHPTAFIDEAGLVIGDVVIGVDSSVWPMSVLRGDFMPISVGERTNIQDGAVVHVTGNSRYTPGGFRATIGSGVTIGHGAIIHSCTVEDNCLVGMHATVLDGAVVRTGAIVGSNSLVPPGREIEGGFLWLGSPVKKIRELSDEERAFLPFSAQSYVELKDRYLARTSRGDRP